MKRLLKKAVIVSTTLILGLFSQGSFAQLNQMGKLLSGGISDAEQIADAYLSPFTNAFGATLNAGWYNTARPHRFPGFDLTLSVNVAIIPEEAKTFNPADIGLSPYANFSGNLVSPTIAGDSDVQGTLVSYTEMVDGEQVIRAEFNLPQGTGLGFIPAPTLQLGIGLPFGTDIIGRYIPEVGLDDIGNMGLWGIGVKHSLKQWIPVINRLPVVNLSVMAGYTKFYTGTPLSFSPADIGADDNTSVGVDFTNQNLNFGVGSFTANVIASADIPFITGYMGVGINSTSTNLRMTGWYPIPVIDYETSQTEVTDASAVYDPVDFRLAGETGGIQPRLTAGFKIKLAVLHIHFDYTYANYSVVTGGIGISVR